MGWLYLDPTRLFFSILKLVSFKKFNGVRRDVDKEQNIGNYGYICTWILRKYRKYRKISVDILTKISVMQKLTKIL